MDQRVKNTGQALSFDKKKARGRPSDRDFDARQALIEAAKIRFSRQTYEKVTTRLLAEDAGVNVGLIKYYFINKEGQNTQTTSKSSTSAGE